MGMKNFVCLFKSVSSQSCTERGSWVTKVTVKVTETVYSLGGCVWELEPGEEGLWQDMATPFEGSSLGLRWQLASPVSVPLASRSVWSSVPAAAAEVLSQQEHAWKTQTALDEAFVKVRGAAERRLLCFIKYLNVYPSKECCFWLKLNWNKYPGPTLTSMALGRPPLFIQGWTSVSSFFCSSEKRGWLFCSSLSFSLSSLSTLWMSLQKQANAQPATFNTTHNQKQSYWTMLLWNVGFANEWLLW